MRAIRMYTLNGFEPRGIDAESLREPRIIRIAAAEVAHRLAHAQRLLDAERLPGRWRRGATRRGMHHTLVEYGGTADVQRDTRARGDVKPCTSFAAV